MTIIERAVRVKNLIEIQVATSRDDLTRSRVPTGHHRPPAASQSEADRRSGTAHILAGLHRARAIAQHEAAFDITRGREVHVPNRAPPWKSPAWGKGPDRCDERKNVVTGIDPHIAPGRCADAAQVALADREIGRASCRE